MRLDRFLATVKVGSRSEVKKLLKQGVVMVDGVVVKDGKTQINEDTAVVTSTGQALHYQKYYYYLLHKPQGVISATQDRQKTVLDLLQPADFHPDLFPVGRLDKDTEGLLLLTNDGPLAHDLLSPKKHVAKVYYAKISGIVTEDEVAQFALGFAIDGGETVQPSELTVLSVDVPANTSEISLVIHEGKYHQVKRMFQAWGMKVTYLKRTQMADLTLGDLPLGQYRKLTAEEVDDLKNPE